MEAIRAAVPATEHRGSSVLTVGFGSAVAMWAVGYLSRLPAVMLPSPILLLLVLACLVGGGCILGRYAALGWRHGAVAGLITGGINLLVLGSFLGGDQPNRIVPSALLWLPGSILVAAVLAAAGAMIGQTWLRRDPPYEQWVSGFVRVAVGAVLLLLVVGGLVTSTGAGLAVVDWPNSFGYNMFLYPFSRMTGGIYYEHTHRLFGALVGLTTLVLAVLLQLREPRRGVRALGWAVFAMVVMQGVLGGLRVTGGFTLSESPEAMRPSVALAMVHGVFGQVVFACLVALGALTSAVWCGTARPRPTRTVVADRVLTGLLVAVVFAQLILGAAQRHLGSLLLVHIVFGVAVVTPVALHVGLRTWATNEGRPRLQRLGFSVAVAIALQLLLGLGAFVAVRAAAAGDVSPATEALLTTVHQGFGAGLLGLAVSLFCWSFRLVAPDPAASSTGSFA